MSRQERRQGVSFIELLIALAILSTLVGVVTPMIQNEIRSARSARTAKEMSQIQKSLQQAARKEGFMAPFVPDTPYSFPKTQRPEFAIPVEALIPQFLSEMPKDSWGEEIYRYGNYIMSNGANGIAGDEDDVFIKVTEFPEERDPDSGAVLMSREENEAFYQVAFLALKVKEYIKKVGTPPATLYDVYDESRQGSPLDPWGEPYQLVDESTLKVVASRGPDATTGTDDDITARWDEADLFEDSFRLGFRGWVKIYPTGETPQTTPIEWVQDADEAKNRMRFKGDGLTGLHTSAWVKPYPSGTDVTPISRVTVKFSATRNPGSGPIQLGLLLNYNGPGTGVRGSLILEPDGGDPLLRLDNNAPRPGLQWDGGSPARGVGAVEISGDTFADTVITLEIVNGSPPQARFRVDTGPYTGMVSQDLRGAPPKIGSCGFYVRAPTPDSKFVVEFDDFGVYKN